MTTPFDDDDTLNRRRREREAAERRSHDLNANQNQNQNAPNRRTILVMDEGDYVAIPQSLFNYLSLAQTTILAAVNVLFIYTAQQLLSSSSVERSSDLRASPLTNESSESTKPEPSISRQPTGGSVFLYAKAKDELTLWAQEKENKKNTQEPSLRRTQSCSKF